MRLLVGSVMTILILGTASLFAAPKIIVDNPLYEVSIRSAGSVVQHAFILTNEGDQTLTISDVLPTCDCTTVSPTKADVAPGESLVISVSVDTTGFVGVVARAAAVLSNDPTNANLMLIVSVRSGGSVQETPRFSVSELKKRFYILVDVRTVEEYAAGHLLGAINIPLSGLQNDLSTWILRLPRDVPIILQCKSGARSAQAAQILLKAGFSNIVELDGGIAEWANSYGSRYLFGY